MPCSSAALRGGICGVPSTALLTVDCSDGLRSTVGAVSLETARNDVLFSAYFAKVCAPNFSGFSCGFTSVVFSIIVLFSFGSALWAVPGPGAAGKGFAA